MLFKPGKINDMLSFYLTWGGATHDFHFIALSQRSSYLCSFAMIMFSQGFENDCRVLILFQHFNNIMELVFLMKKPPIVSL